MNLFQISQNFLNPEVGVDLYSASS